MDEGGDPDVQEQKGGIRWSWSKINLRYMAVILELFPLQVGIITIILCEFGERCRAARVVSLLTHHDESFHHTLDVCTTDTQCFPASFNGLLGAFFPNRASFPHKVPRPHPRRFSNHRRCRFHRTEQRPRGTRPHSRMPMLPLLNK